MLPLLIPISWLNNNLILTVIMSSNKTETSSLLPTTTTIPNARDSYKNQDIAASIKCKKVGKQRIVWHWCWLIKLNLRRWGEGYWFYIQDMGYGAAVHNHNQSIYYNKTNKTNNYNHHSFPRTSFLFSRKTIKLVQRQTKTKEQQGRQNNINQEEIILKPLFLVG